MEQQHFAWPYCAQAQASSSADSSCNVGGGEQTSGVQVPIDLPHVNAHVLDDQLQELALHLCRQELENCDGLDLEDSTGRLHTCCRSSNYSWDPILLTPGIVGMPSLQNLLAEGLQDPLFARLLSTESLLVKALETGSCEAPEKASQVESSNYSFYSIHKSDGKLQNPREIHDHSSAASARPLDWEEWSTSESHTSLSYRSFFSNEHLRSDPLLSQMEIQPSRVKQEVDNADPTMGQDLTSLSQTLPFPQLISNIKSPTRWVTELPDLLSQILSSCSTSQSNPLGSCMSKLIPENHIQSPAGANLSRDKSSATSSTCMQSHGEAAFNRNLGKTSIQIRDSFKEYTSYSGFLENSEQALEPFFKRPRIELNPSFPFKVRKEKLGERITELQQLVSPFGKTDIASVLLEAIGYIKFLHEQVQALSTPYMKSSTMPSLQNHESCTRFWSSEQGEDDEEPEQDLRSRGLCLVPLTSTLEVTNANSADYRTPTIAASSR